METLVEVSDFTKNNINVIFVDMTGKASVRVIHTHKEMSLLINNDEKIILDSMGKQCILNQSMKDILGAKQYKKFEEFVDKFDIDVYVDDEMYLNSRYLKNMFDRFSTPVYGNVVICAHDDSGKLRSIPNSFLQTPLIKKAFKM